MYTMKKGKRLDLGGEKAMKIIAGRELQLISHPDCLRHLTDHKSHC